VPTCFVIQPFDKGQYDKRYRDLLEPAIREAGLTPYRVDEDPSVVIPIDDIENRIRESEICLADVTTNNPNIWYEVGFAIANGKPVVFVCLEPRPEPYPFDVRHRHVISYSTQSSSDFEKLKKEVTARLKAQAKKAEELQTVATLSQVKPTEGLSPHEIGVLITITSSVYTPHDGIAPHKIKESMKRSGYTGVASTLALAALKEKDMIEYVEEESGNFNESYTVCRLTDKGLAWMLANQDRFRLRLADVDDEPPEPSSTPITDEDIPF
jgi:hypothetical protein